MAKMNNIQQQEPVKKNCPAARWLVIATIFFLFAGVFIVGKVVYIRWVWKPDPRCLEMSDFKLQAQKHITKPQRGNITDCRGRLLAITIPTYTVELDCGVRKDYYAKDTSINKKTGEKNGVEKEREWRNGARKFAEALPGVLKDGTNAAEVKNEIFRRRDAAPGSKVPRTLKIADNVDYETLQALKKLPLACEKQHIGGIIITAHFGREYPYGKLARSTIGYVRSNDEGARARGVEGSYNYALYGTEGVEWRKKVDNGAWVKDEDSTNVAARNGSDVRLTIDIDIQDIADRAVRKHIEDDENIEEACMIVMDVKTGAVKAMVNLHKGPDGKFDESLNIALTKATEPGSVFKTVGLMTELEDGKVRLGTRIPTNHGKIENFPDDRHIVDYERNRHKTSISVLEGLEMSSNYVFTRLALDNYRNHPQEFMNRYYDYGFGTKWDFDIKGMAPSTVPDPKSAGWTLTDLGSVAYGYSAQVTPLHTLAFYNAIANKGNLVKPYIVARISDPETGKASFTAKTESLNRSICRRSTADTLTRALRCVVTDGTGSRLKSAKCAVAGKTGTARMRLDKSEMESARHPYQSKDGKRRNQGSFVGFFPAEDPVYSAIVVVYSRLSSGSYYGGTRPAEAFKEVVDEIYSLDPRWRETAEATGTMPAVKVSAVEPEKATTSANAPSVIGLGLNEALYIIENSGFQCKFSGVGHVVSQSPAAGAALKKGGVVTIALK